MTCLSGCEKPLRLASESLPPGLTRLPLHFSKVTNDQLKSPGVINEAHWNEMALAVNASA